jgi:glycosyltransferase involved in cell wall biosynthesis
MDISILICTYNRAGELRRSLASHAAMAVPASVRWELLVVDNNSTDDTPAVVESCQGSLPVRYLCEKQQGKSHALNRGFSECRGELVLMTDDDVDVTGSWLADYFHAARQFPEAAFFGGRIETRWEEPPPEWLAVNAGWLDSTPVLDWGREPQRLTLEAGRAFLVGANMAVRRSAFAAGFRFREDLGPIGRYRDARAQHGGEEGEWQSRVLASGMSGMYLPEPLVYHRESRHRATRGYIRWYYRNLGIEIRRREGIPPVPALLKAPRYLWRRLLTEGACYYYHRLISSPRVWLKLDCERALTMGEIQECRRMAREN